MVKRRASPKAPSPLMADLRFKLLRVVRRHEQMKSAFAQLNLQIKIGLQEAEDVFASLSIPLMKLVGLKSDEMAEEGRSSTILFNSNLQQRNVSGSETPTSSSPFSAEDTDQIHNWKEKKYCSKASQSGKEIMEKQHLQLQKLIHLLRMIEANVNSRQGNILRVLNDNRDSLQDFFQKSLFYIYSIHDDQKIQTNNKSTLIVTLKLLRAIFDNVGSVLDSVEDGVHELMRELAQNMCTPMVEYVKGLREETSDGSLRRLMAVVEEMESVMRDGLDELEEAKRRVRVEEQRKLEALSRLRESEEKRRAMKEFVGFLLEAKERSKGPFVPHEHLAVEDVRAAYKEWVEKKKLKLKSSPWGTKDLLTVLPYSNHQKLEGSNCITKKAKPIFSQKQVTDSYKKGLGLGTPSSNVIPLLGSSPSMVVHHGAARKHSPSSLISVGATELVVFDPFYLDISTWKL